MENKKVLIYSKVFTDRCYRVLAKSANPQPAGFFSFLLYRLTVVMCVVFSYVLVFLRGKFSD